ncbi:MAG: MarR family winged helix-turn-helix transcriptional regulator [Desulfobacterales bacterium]
MPKLPDDLPECLIFLLGKAYQKAHNSFKKRLKPYGLTNIQHLVLEGLWYKNGMTATELSSLLMLDKATLSGVLERMAETGWITRVPDSEDRRIHRVYPSEKANDLKEALIRERQESNREILERFSYEERVVLKRLLRELI